MQILAGQPDHRRDQPRQLGPAGVGGVVVDIAGERGQQRMRAGRVVTPSLSRQIRCQLHETRALARTAMVAPRQNRDQLRHRSLVTGHGHLHSADRPAMTSLRPFDTRQHPALARWALPPGTPVTAGELNGHAAGHLPPRADNVADRDCLRPPIPCQQTQPADRAVRPAHRRPVAHREHGHPAAHPDRCSYALSRPSYAEIRRVCCLLRGGQDREGPLLTEGRLLSGHGIQQRAGRGARGGRRIDRRPAPVAAAD